MGERPFEEGEKSMEIETIKYNTRDGKGKDIVAEVKIKKFPVCKVDFTCPICHASRKEGCRTKEIVSANFTDWTYVGDYVCENCAKLFSLYFYSYIVDGEGIRILNVRELREALIAPQKPPFMFCITTSRKKHLFYRAMWNGNQERFAVNLETETIYTTSERMRELFDLVECLQTLGAPKERLRTGDIPFPVLSLFGIRLANRLIAETSASREIQIPLFCGQKREISEEDAICIINSILTT